MDDEMEDATDRVEVPARLAAGMAVGNNANVVGTYENLGFRYSWAKEGEFGDDEESAAEDRDKVQKLLRISPDYWAAKTMICSPQLKEHMRSSPDLARALEERGYTYGELKRMCYADQKFAVLVADDIGLLKDVIKRLKVNDANALSPDNVPVITDEDPERFAFNPTQADWASVYKTRYETILLKVVSKEYENRVDLIEGKIVLLTKLLMDLRNDEEKLPAKFFDQLPKLPPRVGKFKEHRGHMEAMMIYLDKFLAEEMNGTMRAHVQTFATRLGEAGEATMAL